MLPFYMLAMLSDASPSGDYTIMVFLYCIYALIGFRSRENEWKLVKRCNRVRDLIHHDQWFFAVNYERNITVYNENFEEIWKCTTPYLNGQPGAYHLQFFKASGRLVVLQLSSYAVSIFNRVRDLIHHDQWFFSVNYERNITVYNENFEEIWKCTTPYLNGQPGAYHLQFFKASGRLVVLQLSSYAVSIFNVDVDLLHRYENSFPPVGRLGDHTVFCSFGRPIALPADSRHLSVSKLGCIYMAAKDSITECNVVPDEDGNYSKFCCVRELQLLAEEFGYYRYLQFLMTELGA